MSSSAVRDVHAPGRRLQAGPGLGLDRPQPDDAGYLPSRQATRRPAAPGRPGRTSSTPPWPRTRAGAVPGPGRPCSAPAGARCCSRWSHIDLDRGEVLVGGKITSSRGSCGTRSGPRTAPASRVAIGPAVVEPPRSARRVEQPSRRSLVGSASRPMHAFSHEADGSRPIRPDGVTQRFTALARRLSAVPPP